MLVDQTKWRGMWCVIHDNGVYAFSEDQDFMIRLMARWARKWPQFKWKLVYETRVFMDPAPSKIQDWHRQAAP